MASPKAPITRPQEAFMRSPRLQNQVVRVTLPAEAYYNLDQFQKLQKDILGKLGCLGCTSGYDIRYNLQTRFQIDEKLNILAMEPGFELDIGQGYER